MVIIYRGAYSARFGGSVIPAIGRRRRTGQRGARLEKLRAVEKLDESDHVTATAALATVEYLLCSADAEPIITTTFWTRASPFHLRLI